MRVQSMYTDWSIRDFYIPAEIKFWTFDADTYCPGCTNARFGGEALQNDTARDSEGNPVHPVFTTDEWEGEIVCADCKGVIA